MRGALGLRPHLSVRCTLPERDAIPETEFFLRVE